MAPRREERGGIELPGEVPAWSPLAQRKDHVTVRSPPGTKAEATWWQSCMMLFPLYS